MNDVFTYRGSWDCRYGPKYLPFPPLYSLPAKKKEERICVQKILMHMNNLTSAIFYLFM